MPAAKIKAAPLRERVANAKRMFETALNHSNLERTKAVFTWLEALRTGSSKHTTAPATEVPTSVVGESHYPFDLALAQSGMPRLARNILESTNFLKLAKIRRANFEKYSQLLIENNNFKILFPKTSEQTCPWVFPVLLTNRDSIDHRWRADGVALHTFGIYLHSALFQYGDSNCVADAKYLAEHILCLAIHQNISSMQVELYSRSIKRFNAYQASASTAGI